MSTEFCAEPPLPFPVKETLYRVAQEALNNTVKHSHASQVLIRLTEGDGDVLLEIQDDGTGFDPNGDHPGHLGLQSMRERTARFGGVMEISSVPGEGTRVQVRLPQPTV